MDVPSARELELQSSLRTRDAQINDLTDELCNIRRILPSQAVEVSPQALIQLPPSIVSLLLPVISGPSQSEAGKTKIQSSVTTALSLRLQHLQEENDELYSLLRRSETGKLKEQVDGLNQVVSRTTAALKESHAMIKSLSAELDKAYETLQAQMSSITPTSAVGSPNPGRIPSRLAGGQHDQSPNHQLAKPLPTGPRAQKRARLSPPTSQRPPSRPHDRLRTAHDTTPRRSRSPPPPISHQSAAASAYASRRQANHSARQHTETSPPLSTPRLHHRESNGMDLDLPDHASSGSYARLPERSDSKDRTRDERPSMYPPRLPRRSPPGSERNERPRRSGGSRRGPRNSNGAPRHSNNDRRLADRIGM